MRVCVVSTVPADGVPTVDEPRSRGKTKQQPGEMIRRRESEAGGSLEAQGGGVGVVAWMWRGVQMGGPLIHGG